VRIIVSDGGSSDSTRQIADAFGCEILSNALRLAEPGVDFAIKKVKAGIAFVMAADTELPRSNWIRLMMQPLLTNSSVAGVFTHIINSSDDTYLTKYLNSIHADPFAWFVYGEGRVNPRFMHEKYPVYDRTPQYVVFDFPLHDFPLIGLGHGFGIRLDRVTRHGDIYDDIAPVYEIVRRGWRIAYVPTAGIYHHQIEGFRHFVPKYLNRMVKITIPARGGIRSRMSVLPIGRKIRAYLWFVYSLCPFLTMADSAKGIKRTGERARLLHPLVSAMLTILVGISFLLYKTRER
jgi:glycosyltransferase involved in cell wall biosynthesis